MARVLLVDDSSAMLETLSLALRSKGHSVVTAQNGGEGIEIFGTDQFDLVVTDILMPDMDGIGMIDEMRRLAPNLKIVAISGGGVAVHFDFLNAAKHHGAVATLEKPFSLSDFHTVLDKCLQT